MDLVQITKRIGKTAAKGVAYAGSVAALWVAIMELPPFPYSLKTYANHPKAGGYDIMVLEGKGKREVVVGECSADESPGFDVLLHAVDEDGDGRFDSLSIQRAYDLGVEQVPSDMQTLDVLVENLGEPTREMRTRAFIHCMCTKNRTYSADARNDSRQI